MMDYQERRESIDFDTAVMSAANYVLLEVMNSGCDVAALSSVDEQILLRLMQRGELLKEEDLLSRSYFADAFKRFTGESIFLIILKALQGYIDPQFYGQELRHGFCKYKVGERELSVEIRIEGDPVPQRMIMKVHQ